MRRRLPAFSYNRLVHHRLEVMLFLFTLVYVALLARLFYLQIYRYPFFREEAAKRRFRKVIVLARRGAIRDRNGRVFAMDSPAFLVNVSPKEIPANEREMVIRRLSTLLNLGREALAARLNSKPRGVIIKRQIRSQEIEQQLKEAALPGVYLEQDPVRIYNGEAAHVVGFTNIDRKGVDGLELSLDQYLACRSGLFEAEFDRKGRAFPGTRCDIIPAHDGDDLTLTLDADLQHDAQQALLEAYQEHHAAGGSVIVLDPWTGEILAMTNAPTFDPNRRRPEEGAKGYWRNRAITDLYEPGSTLKLITAAAGLDTGAITTGTTFYCQGQARVGRRTIRCVIHAPFHHGHGAETVQKILQYSCNIGAAGIGRRVGRKRLAEYLHRFGIGSETGIPLPGEATGRIVSPQEWPEIRLANVAFGQGVQVTALQLAMAYAAIANGGTLMKPLLVKEITNSKGQVKYSAQPQPVRRVVSEQTARLLTQFLRTVVDKGTGKTAKILGYTVAGKTGSAQKARTNGRGYEPGKFIASFVGFFPATHPRYLILAVLDEPKGTHWGATVAAPVFKAVGERLARMQGIPEDDPASRERAQTRLVRISSPRHIFRSVSRSSEERYLAHRTIRTARYSDD